MLPISKRRAISAVSFGRSAGVSYSRRAPETLGIFTPPNACRVLTHGVNYLCDIINVCIHNE